MCAPVQRRRIDSSESSVHDGAKHIHELVNPILVSKLGEVSSGLNHQLPVVVLARFDASPTGAPFGFIELICSLSPFFVRCSRTKAFSRGTQTELLAQAPWWNKKRNAVLPNAADSKIRDYIYCNPTQVVQSHAPLRRYYEQAANQPQGQRHKLRHSLHFE